MITIDVYLKITFIVWAFPAFLLACTPVTDQHQIITVESFTPTYNTQTNTPSLTPTITLTPTFVLPTIEILATPTEGVYSIKPNNANRIRELGTIGFGKAYESVWSPNDEHLAIKTSSGLALYDTETWNLVKILEPSISERFEWSPNGKFLITASLYSGEDQTVHLFDGETLDQIKVFNNGRDYSLSPNGEMLAILGDWKTSFYELNSLKLLSSVPFETSSSFSSFSPDGRTYAVLDGEEIHIWDTYTGKSIQSFENAIEDGDWIRSFTYCPSGESLLYLATRGGFDYILKIWDISTSREVYSSQGFLDYREAVDAAFSPDGDQAAVLI
jgi:WD40 repeat protein